MSFFDECYRTVSDLSSRPKDFDKYWETRIQQLSKIPMETDSEKRISRKMLTENKVSVTFQSAGKVRVRADIIAPRKMMGKPPVVILLPDYMEEPSFYPLLQQNGIAQVVLHYRGQDEIFRQRKEAAPEDKGAEEKSFGFFQENLDDRDAYYMGNLYLDLFRLLEVLRLRKALDSSRIGIWGRGVGAALALFATRYMNRTSALFLESPSFCHLEVSQNKSKAPYAHEINTYIKTQRRDKAKVKENLKYFDSIFFADRIFTDLVEVAPFRSKIYVPQSAFALFHCFPADKEMVVYTKESKLMDEKLRSDIIRLAGSFFSEKFS